MPLRKHHQEEKAHTLKAHILQQIKIVQTLSPARSHQVSDTDQFAPQMQGSPISTEIMPSAISSNAQLKNISWKTRF